MIVKAEFHRSEVRRRALSSIPLLQEDSLFQCKRGKWVEQLGRDAALSKFSFRDNIGVSSAVCIPSDFPESESIWVVVNTLFMSLCSI